MTLPNFLVIGAAKCGTDSLCNYLAQHPEVYIPPQREPNFFVADGQPLVPYTGPGDRVALASQSMWISTREEYEKLFAGVTTEKAIGEGTAWYIYYEDAPARIKRYIPDVKLIAILRNPVDRAYSAFTMLRRDAREPISDFSTALSAEEERTRLNWEPIWHYTKMGFYAEQIKRLYKTFSRDQIRVYLYDDYNVNPLNTVQDAFSFLGVDERFNPDTTTRYNVSMVPKISSLHTLVAGEHRLKNAMKAVLPNHIRQALKQRVVERNLQRPAPIDPAIRQRLMTLFRPDILELQDVLGRDLSRWLSDGTVRSRQ